MLAIATFMVRPPVLLQEAVEQTAYLPRTGFRLEQAGAGGAAGNTTGEAADTRTDTGLAARTTSAPIAPPATAGTPASDAWKSVRLETP
jgi:hypothetical protein